MGAGVGGVCMVKNSGTAEKTTATLSSPGDFRLGLGVGGCSSLVLFPALRSWLFVPGFCGGFGGGVGAGFGGGAAAVPGCPWLDPGTVTTVCWLALGAGGCLNLGAGGCMHLGVGGSLNLATSH